jgi:putative ABC transport system permease protein
MSLVSQIVTVTATNLRNIPQRLGSSLVIVVGIAGVVAVLIPVLAMFLGFRATIEGDGRADRAIVIAHDTEAEYDSNISREIVAGVMNAPGVKRDASGKPIASAEVVLVAPVSRKRDNSDVNVTLRGVGEHYFTLRPELKVASGRMFTPGTQELLVGASAAAQFAGLEIGSQVRLQDGDWTAKTSSRPCRVSSGWSNAGRRCRCSRTCCSPHATID